MIGGEKVLFLRGSHYDRGYEHGFLLAREVREVFHEMFVAHLFRGDTALYNYAKSFLVSHFEYENKYRIEADGMIAGMADAGVGLYDSLLFRTVDAMDLLMMSSTEELFNIVELNFGCSSISSWGASTAGDPQLKGELVITRHWDYPRFAPMVKNLVLIVHCPSEANENSWVNGTWAGMIGSCTAMNDKGIGAFLNYGPPDSSILSNLSNLHSISLSVRNGIEERDHNGDAKATVEDVVSSIMEHTSYSGSIVHIVSPATNDTPAVVVESNNARGSVRRTIFDNGVLPGKNLAATNHYRVLYPPLPCVRYQNIIDSLNASPDITIERSWRLLAGAGALQDCIYSISYIPSQGLIRWAVTTLDNAAPAYDLSIADFTISQLMGK